MASNESNAEDSELCCIEASVVTGFEECARGEAKEKFDVTDVSAVRGKITWKIPIHRVTEVIKMGSIDNCRVVIHSVPHFGFSDQHESLAGVQKLVLDMDWDQGLRVWRKFNEFAHPILSKPDVIPKPEELVDVVIMPQREKPEKSGGKKSKKEKWKKQKEERKARRAQQEKNETVAEPEGKQCENKGAECVAEADSGCSLSTPDQQDKSNVTIDENGTKTVIVKQLDPNQPAPEIEIKVLIPGPNENVFPTDINEKDQRDLEPMDVDKSMHQIPTDDIFDSPSKNLVKLDGKEENATPSPPQPRSQASPFKQPSAPISILSSAKDFASSVIERLTSTSPQSLPVKPSDNASSLPTCATPPSTPVHQNLDFYMKSRMGQNLPPVPVVSNVPHSSKSPVHFCVPSSSVDKDVIVKAKVDSEKKSDDVKAVSNANKEKSNVVNSDNEPGSNVDAPPVVSPAKKERDPTKPTFRVTCNRVGDNHSFDSSSAAASLGSAIISYFGWSVDLKNFDIEVLLNIDNEEVTVSLAITKSSLHNRNLVAFGPTTLRATICYNMLRLCRVRNGDFVCDPMCGTSALPVEGSVNWVNSFFFGGDYHEKGIERSLQNISAINQKWSEEQRGSLKIGTVQWNIEHFPLRDQCVDVFVSDLPFGHRMGSRSNNRTLYPTLLSAMARTARTGARACLLTEDKTSLIKALQTLGKFWQRRLILSINMGGLSGFVFLLTRTTACYSAPDTTWTKEEDTPTACPNETASTEAQAPTSEDTSKQASFTEN